METKDWISIASAFIIATGWFVTGYLNRIKDIAQKRLEYRLKALEAFLPVWFAIGKDGNAFSNPELFVQFDHARAMFHLYGYSDENILMEQLTSALREKNITKFNDALQTLTPLVRSRIRKELEISG